MNKDDLIEHSPPDYAFSLMQNYRKVSDVIANVRNKS